jgi:ABC-2 type transport system permease protein
MTFLLQTALLTRRRILEMLRQPIWVFMGMSVPLMYLALFAPLLKPLSGGPGFPGGSVLDVFVPGILALMAFGAGTGAGWVVLAELESGVIERLRVTPASRLALVLGTVLRDVVMFAVPAAVVLAVATPFGFRPHWAGLALLLGLLALLTAACSASSAALGITLKQIGSLAAVVTGLQLPLTLLAGVLLPLSLGPGWLQGLAHANPMYYAVEAARALASGTLASATVAEGFGVMAGVAIVAVWWCTRTYRRAMA